MKRLLTTAMVLVMLVTMFCASPVVTAAGNPEMKLKVINTDSGYDDTISATFTDVSDAKWVVWSVKNESGKYLYIEERRGNNAEASDFIFLVNKDEKSALQTSNSNEKLVVEATISYATGSPVTRSEEIKYNTYSETQLIIRDMLAGTKSIEDAANELYLPLPEYYVSNPEIDERIKSKLEDTFSVQIADSTQKIEPIDFYNNLLSEIRINSINDKNPTVIANILSNFYSEFGISVTDVQRLWYDESATKNDVATRLAAFNYETLTDFVNQFKTIAFLDRLAFEPIPKVMDFLKTNDNTYVNYGTATEIKSTNITEELMSLNFTTSYDETTLSADIQEKAAEYMKNGGVAYASLDALKTRFSELLLKLADPYDPDFQSPQNPVYTPPVSTGSSGSSVSVGLVTPIVGGNSNPFTDIDDVEWAKEAIIALAQEGVIEGVSAKSYQPNSNVTREQFVKIIVNTFGLKGTGAVATFDDVDQKEWYAPYINTAVELGIIKGTSDTRFGVEQNISRQDMTLIMYRVAKYVGVDVTAKSGRTFTDANSIDSYAIDAVTALYRAGIVNGVADGVFGGQQTATRAQAAKLCYDLRESK